MVVQEDGRGDVRKEKKSRRGSRRRRRKKESKFFVTTGEARDPLWRDSSPSTQ